MGRKINPPRVVIRDDNGELWASSEHEAELTGLGILHDAEQGRVEGYRPFIGDSWKGDLVLLEEIARLR